MPNEKTFTFDVKKISNGYIIFDGDVEVFKAGSNEVNQYIEGKVELRIKDHIVDCFPKGTAQRLVVTIGVSGKVMG